MRSTCFALVLAFAASAGAGACKHAQEAETDPKPLVTVRIDRVKRADVQVVVTAPAVVHAREQASIAARITARIRELKAKKGDDVKAGQLLATLDAQDIAAQKDEAEAAVNDAQAAMEKTKGGTFFVEIERAKGQLDVAQATFNQADKVFEKRQQLFKEGAIPQRELLLAQTERETQRANLVVAKKNLELLQGEKDVRMAESRLKQAGARLSFQQASLGFSQIRSPFTGTITEQFVFPGDMASPTGPMFTVMDLSIAVARAQIPETDARRVRSGMPCRFTPNDDSGAALEGTVTVLNKAVDLQRRTVEGWCEIPNQQGELRAGVFGTVTVLCGTDKDSLVVPRKAVVFKEGTKTGSVLLVDGHRIANNREIKAGVVTPDRVQIKEGLALDDQVAIEGGYNVPDGAEVTFATDDAGP